MKTFLVRIFLVVASLVLLTKLENPVVAVLFAILASCLLLWWGVESARRSFAYRQSLGHTEIRVESGTTSLFVSLLVTLLIFELAKEHYWETVTLVRVFWILFIFAGLWSGFEKLTQHLAKKHCPEIQFTMWTREKY